MNLNFNSLAYKQVARKNYVTVNHALWKHFQLLSPFVSLVSAEAKKMMA